MFVSLFSFSQNAKEVMRITKSVADKIIRETSFEFDLIKTEAKAGFTLLDSPFVSENNEEAIMYSYSKISANSKKDSYLRLSFVGDMTVFLNGKEILSNNSKSFLFKEYTYNRFVTNCKIPLSFSKGVNELLLKYNSQHETSGIMVFFSDSIDQVNKELEFTGLIVNDQKIKWLQCGPFFVKNKGENAFPPEKGFENYYKMGDRILTWSVPKSLVIRELKINNENSFKRDSYADWHYANGGTMFSVYALGKLINDDKYITFVEDYASNILENYEYFDHQFHYNNIFWGSFMRLYRMTMLDDTGGPAIPFAQLEIDKPEEKNHALLLKELDYVLNNQVRLEDNTFCRPEPEPETIWADDLFMLTPFLLRMAEITEDAKIYDEICQQIINFNSYLCNKETGLYFHGWYNDRMENTPVQWGRANGWVIWAESEALLHLPKSHKGYKKILKIYRNHIRALCRYQNENGLWNQVLDHPETYDETSCTAMFTLAIARGVRMGWLSKSMKDYALKGWKGIESKIGKDGTVKDICRGTGIGDNIDFYQDRKCFDHDPRGLGAVITAGIEINQLLKLSTN